VYAEAWKLKVTVWVITEATAGVGAAVGVGEAVGVGVVPEPEPVPTLRNCGMSIGAATAAATRRAAMQRTRAMMSMLAKSPM